MVCGVWLTRAAGAGRRRAEAGETRWRGGRSLLLSMRRTVLRSGLRRRDGSRLRAGRAEAAGRRPRRVAAVLGAVSGLLVGTLLTVVAAVLTVVPVLVVLGPRRRWGDHARIQQECADRKDGLDHPAAQGEPQRPASAGRAESCPRSAAARPVRRRPPPPRRSSWPSATDSPRPAAPPATPGQSVRCCRFRRLRHRSGRTRVIIGP